MIILRNGFLREKKKYGREDRGEKSQRRLRKSYVDVERKLFLERKERDRDSSVNADRLHS